MKRRFALGLAGLGLLAGLWFFSERILFAMNWTNMGLDGAEIIAGLRADLAAGRTGIVVSDLPCVKDRVALDLSVNLTGHLPRGEQVIMRISVTGPQAMFDQIYLGPPVPVIRVDATPLCLTQTGPLADTDEEAFAYLNISFYDLEENQFQSFGSEDADPIFAWQDINVELLERPEKSRSQGVTRLKITPAM
ncbi:MAG: hypothetical protein ABJL99_15200 [Aliishimia sp.]